MTERKLVYPGDEVGEAEEFLAGPGTYVEDHKILAATVGELGFDEKEFKVYVTPAKPMNECTAMVAPRWPGAAASIAPAVIAEESPLTVNE